MTNTTTTQGIRFLRHAVTNGSAKCPVHYSYGDTYIAPRSQETRKAVTIYSKSYCEHLFPIFGARVENNSDITTDYFEHDRVHVFEDDPLFAAAKAAYDEGRVAAAERDAKVQAKRDARLRLEVRWLKGGVRVLINRRTGEPFAINGKATFANIVELGDALLTIGMRLSTQNWQPVTATKNEIAKMSKRAAQRAFAANVRTWAAVAA